eukprot:193588-Rhodomonas_salina.4
MSSSRSAIALLNQVHATKPVKAGSAYQAPARIAPPPPKSFARCSWKHQKLFRQRRRKFKHRACSFLARLGTVQLPAWTWLTAVPDGMRDRSGVWFRQAKDAHLRHGWCPCSEAVA